LRFVRKPGVAQCAAATRSQSTRGARSVEGDCTGSREIGFVTVSREV